MRRGNTDRDALHYNSTELKINLDLYENLKCSNFSFPNKSFFMYCFQLSLLCLYKVVTNKNNYLSVFLFTLLLNLVYIASCQLPYVIIADNEIRKNLKIVSEQSSGSDECLNKTPRPPKN